MFTFSWRDEEREDVRQRRQCAQLLGVAAETAEGTLAPIVGSMYVRAHFDSDIWLEAQESKVSMLGLHSFSHLWHRIWAKLCELS